MTGLSGRYDDDDDLLTDLQVRRSRGSEGQEGQRAKRVRGQRVIRVNWVNWVRTSTWTRFASLQFLDLWQI